MGTFSSILFNFLNIGHNLPAVFATTRLSRKKEAKQFVVSTNGVRNSFSFTDFEAPCRPV